MLLLAGVIAGALYNPWTGPQTREKLMDIIAGNDDLQPLETFDDLRGRDREGQSAVDKGADAASDTAKAAADKVDDAASATKSRASKAADKVEG